jgi:hypothetical protein
MRVYYDSTLYVECNITLKNIAAIENSGQGVNQFSFPLKLDFFKNTHDKRLIPLCNTVIMED